MTNDALKAVRELTYIANEIAYTMAANPNKSALQIAGDISDTDSELARLNRAIEAVAALIEACDDPR